MPWYISVIGRYFVGLSGVQLFRLLTGLCSAYRLSARKILTLLILNVQESRLAVYKPG
jgi:hypothetical protein